MMPVKLVLKCDGYSSHTLVEQKGPWCIENTSSKRTLCSLSCCEWPYQPTFWVPCLYQQLPQSSQLAYDPLGMNMVKTSTVMSSRKYMPESLKRNKQGKWRKEMVLSGLLVTIIWRILRLQTEEGAPHVWRLSVNILNKQSQAGDKKWISSLGVEQGAKNS
jgi:hypothetical protein